MILMIDNYDSFTYNLVQFLGQLEEEVLVKRNDEISIAEIEELQLGLIIISPGPCTPKEAGISLEVIDRFKGKVPILGICLGHQSIGHAFGAEIIEAREPVHGKVHHIKHNNKGVFKDLNNPLRVTRYHSLIIDRDTLPEELEITAESEGGEIMGIKHKDYLIEGVQFHPEAILTEQGHELLNNFIIQAKGALRDD
ncbi:aminodeoxychorismate/anthranilate synthase component II [Orenia metallireducens]|jgi:para-aminobenzoate synthetase component 2|uniref:Aminodeoxychorismate/anthranilate synthase component II n=1 Tax=Orenia metallireducens TaxID=1413210 RepID=A0A1C0A5F3_9FIRM|nr:aminodeoxychorismate/anthranilate synthase component II [Orenia metallireducens]OCL25370.1 aminodeoxychorismate/anthranilate synthase component II [Orenia metallireducens]